MQLYNRLILNRNSLIIQLKTLKIYKSLKGFRSLFDKIKSLQSNRTLLKFTNKHSKFKVLTF